MDAWKTDEFAYGPLTISLQSDQSKSIRDWINVNGDGQCMWWYNNNVMYVMANNDEILIQLKLMFDIT